MRLSAAVRGHPVACLGLAGVLFASWVGFDPPRPDPLYGSGRPTTPLGGPRLPPEERDRLRLGRLLPTLRPGMPRSQVESVLAISPVHHGGNPLRFIAILPQPFPGHPAAVGPCEVTLVFAADQRGEPLTQIECDPVDDPDPPEE